MPQRYSGSFPPSRDDEFAAWFHTSYTASCECDDCTRFRSIVNINLGDEFDPSSVDGLLEMAEMFHQPIMCFNCESTSNLIVYRQRIVCHRCQERMKQCTICNNEFIYNEDDEFNAGIPSRHGVCNTCLPEIEIITCYDCEVDIFINPLIAFPLFDDTGHICSDCRHHYLQCTDCNSYCNEDQAEFIGRRNRGVICRKCTEGYSECHYCRTWRRDNDLTDPCCPDRYVLNYGFKPKYRIYKTELENIKPKTPLIGFELEVSNYEPDRGYDEYDDDEYTPYYIKNNLEWLYCKSDATCGGRGFEIVSYPCTHNFLNQNREDIETLFSKLKNEHYQADDHVGMHIHLSKSACSTLQILKMLQIVFLSPMLVIAVSERKNMSHFQRYSNTFSMNPETIIQTAKTAKRRGSTYNYRSSSATARGVGLNTNPENTIEFRIFNSTLEINHFYKNIQFVKSLYYFTRECSLDMVHEINFLSWVKERKSKYPDLDSFLAKNYRKVY